LSSLWLHDNDAVGHQYLPWLSHLPLLHVRRKFNERTGTQFNHLQFPTDVVLLVVLWRLRYRKRQSSAQQLALKPVIGYAWQDRIISPRNTHDLSALWVYSDDPVVRQNLSWLPHFQMLQLLPEIQRANGHSVQPFAIPDRYCDVGRLVASEIQVEPSRFG
jgi:hypothetical protein